MDALAAAVARQLVDLDHLAFLADGGSWDELRFPLHASDRAWRYALGRPGVRVERSPTGSGLVPWSTLAAIVAAGLTPDRARRVRALAQLGWESIAITPARLRRAGLAPDATTGDIARAADAVRLDVLDAGISALGGEQLALFGEAS